MEQNNTLQFEYFYGIQSEQFSFYRIPKLLIKDVRFKKLSSDAKLLYGMMLDRMSLSIKNGWYDENNRVYIYYTVENIMEDLGCARGTCIKILSELDSKKGIGLIEKKRQGLGKPDIIYVKNFLVIERKENVKNEETKPENHAENQEVQKLDFNNSNNDISRSSKIELQEVQNIEPQKSNNYISENSTIEIQEIQNLEGNHINESYTNFSDTNKSINQSDMIDQIKNSVYNKLSMGELLETNRRDLYATLFSLVLNVLVSEEVTIRVSGQEKPASEVKHQYNQLKREHLEYVADCFELSSTTVKNIESYLITSLYNAPNTYAAYKLKKENKAIQKEHSYDLEEIDEFAMNFITKRLEQRKKEQA